MTGVQTCALPIYTLSKHLPELLPVVAEILTESVFPQDELETYRQNQKQRLQVNLLKCDFVANRFIHEYLFGVNHPYGKYTSIEAYNNLQQNELVNFYNRFYKNGKCILFVAGKLPVNIQMQLNKNFGTLRLNNSSIEIPETVATPATEKKKFILNIKTLITTYYFLFYFMYFHFSQNFFSHFFLKSSPPPLATRLVLSSP